MALKTYDTKDAVPEAQRAAAIEGKDGKWIAEDAELGDAGKKALDAERARAKKAEDEKKAEADKSAAIQKELDDLKRSQSAADKGVSKEALDKLRDEDAKARKPLEDENAKLKAENRKLKHTDRVRALALKHGVMEERIEDAMLTLDRRTDLTTDEKDILVKDAAGDATTEKIDDFLKTTFKKEKPWLYKGTGANGSGSEGSEGGGGTSGYDPVAAGKAAAAAQKKTGEQNALAFR